jgi:hypothetical protein
MQRIVGKQDCKHDLVMLHWQSEWSNAQNICFQKKDFNSTQVATNQLQDLVKVIGNSLANSSGLFDWWLVNPWKRKHTLRITFYENEKKNKWKWTNK